MTLDKFLAIEVKNTEEGQPMSDEARNAADEMLDRLERMEEQGDWLDRLLLAIRRDDVRDRFNAPRPTLSEAIAARNPGGSI